MTTATRRRRHTNRRQVKHPPMTPKQATSFDRFSVANHTIVKRTLHCDCNPYKDVFTYGRWKAQGYQVRRGEHGIHIPVISTTLTPNEEDEEQLEERKLFHSAVVFCRCQVDSANGASSLQQPLIPA